MSRLEYYSRPLVAFDPSNKDHRYYYAEFTRFGGWGHCPVRFICTEEHGDNLPAMIKNSLVQFYVDREFGGDKMTDYRARSLQDSADDMYRKAGQLRKEADILLKPKRK